MSKDRTDLATRRCGYPDQPSGYAEGLEHLPGQQVHCSNIFSDFKFTSFVPLANWQHQVEVSAFRQVGHVGHSVRTVVTY
jgi:hypothetical protein